MNVLFLVTCMKCDSNALVHSCKSVCVAGMQISQCTWCHCPFRGSITWALLCSWLRRCTGSVWSAGEPFASSPGPLATIVPQSVLTLIPKPPSCPQPMATALVTQKESLTPTERHRGAGSKRWCKACFQVSDIKRNLRLNTDMLQLINILLLH